MKIVNKTHWRTLDLARIMRRAAAEEFDDVGAVLKRACIVIAYNRGGTRYRESSGYARMPGDMERRTKEWRPRVRLMVPSGEVDPVDFAHTAAHEFAHTRGIDHDTMRGHPRYRRVGNWRTIYGWAEAMPITRKPEPKARPSLRRSPLDAKIAHARAALSTWERKQKLATTKVKHYRRRLARLERTALGRMAASTPSADGV
jgi:hypothetical protein